MEKDHINLKVAGQVGSRVQFKIKIHTLFCKLMKASCQSQGLSMRWIQFRFDGQPINETDAPAQLEMDDPQRTPEDTTGEDTNSRRGASSVASCLLVGGGRPLEPPSPCGAGLCLLSNSAGVAKPIGRQARTPRTFPRRTLL